MTNCLLVRGGAKLPVWVYPEEEEREGEEGEERKEKGGREGKRRGRQMRKRARERRERDEKQDDEGHHCNDWRIGVFCYSSSSDSEFDSIVKNLECEELELLGDYTEVGPALLCKERRSGRDSLWKGEIFAQKTAEGTEKTKI